MAWNKLFHKDLVCNVRFDEKILFCEDRDFIVKCAARSKRIVYLEEKLIYYYRGNVNAISKQENQDKRIYQTKSLLKERCFMEREFPETLCYAEWVNAALLQNAAFRLKKAKEAARNDLVEFLKSVIKDSEKRLLKTRELSISEKARYYLEYKTPGIFNLLYHIKHVLKR